MQCARCISGVIHPLFSSGFDYFFLFVYPFACDALPDYIICRVVVVVFAKFKAYISYFFLQCLWPIFKCITTTSQCLKINNNTIFIPKVLTFNFRAKMVRMPLQILSQFLAWTFKWRSILNETFLVVFVHCADLFFTTNRNRNRAKRRW